jgi:hypothetical protein
MTKSLNHSGLSSKQEHFLIWTQDSPPHLGNSLSEELNQVIKTKKERLTSSWWSLLPSKDPAKKNQPPALQNSLLKNIS